MISKLQINNYKSLHELDLDVGRFNVLIGENGCGKSNVLEAIALAAAAAADKLDNEFLVSRGIRVTEPQLMRAAFSFNSMLEPIKINLGFENLVDFQKYMEVGLIDLLSLKAVSVYKQSYYRIMEQFQL